MEQEEQQGLMLDDLLNYMLHLFKETEANLKYEKEKLSEIDKELSDLDHFLENNDLQAGKLSKLGKLRKEIRKERREIKNNIEVLLEVQRFTEKYNKKMIVGDLILLKKNLDILEEKHLNPTYTYRTDILQKGGLIDGNDISNSDDNNGMDVD